ncbi:MAG: nucleoside triphosphate pyrophosphohydrolase [Clostridia bacterium]|nr:nucleoside triphosphate pyrophosphohydrolase [Clostridia bacterium]MBQ6614178.1 nucleoside triphosphate pyrophosphohydrolase [Clostridia bacterium]
MNEIKKRLLAKETYDFEDLRDVMRVLRAPGGCPWDMEQDHKSIRENFIEETYEVVEAIDTDNLDLMREELGDVLMQVVFHTQMEEEAGTFSMEDVTTEVCKKLIYRHPHVFSDTVADTSAEVLVNWEKLKNKEKSRETVTDTLCSVPKQYPALLRAQKVGKKAAKVGFDFPSAEEAAKKITEETKELLTATDETRMEELGDLLFAVVNTARQYGLSAEEALAKATDKFISRFSKVEEGVIADGKDMTKLSLEELDKYWDRAKEQKNS